MMSGMCSCCATPSGKNVSSEPRAGSIIPETCNSFLQNKTGIFLKDRDVRLYLCNMQYVIAQYT